MRLLPMEAPPPQGCYLMKLLLWQSSSPRRFLPPAIWVSPLALIPSVCPTSQTLEPYVPPPILSRFTSDNEICRLVNLQHISHLSRLYNLHPWCADRATAPGILAVAAKPVSQLCSPLHPPTLSTAAAISDWMNVGPCHSFPHGALLAPQINSAKSTPLTLLPQPRVASPPPPLQCVLCSCTLASLHLDLS